MSGKSQNEREIVSPSRAPRRKNRRTIQISFQDGILEQYGHAKFSEIGDKDPILYAHSQRPIAILQLKTLRRLQEIFGEVPEPREGKYNQTLTERKKRTNKIAYENTVAGSTAVRECFEDLYVGYDLRHLSLEFKKTRILQENAKLEKQLTELRAHKRSDQSISQENMIPAQSHSFKGVNLYQSSGSSGTSDQTMMKNVFERRTQENNDCLMQLHHASFETRQDSQRSKVTVNSTQRYRQNLPARLSLDPLHSQGIVSNGVQQRLETEKRRENERLDATSNMSSVPNHQTRIPPSQARNQLWDQNMDLLTIAPAAQVPHYGVQPTLPTYMEVDSGQFQSGTQRLDSMTGHMTQLFPVLPTNSSFPLTTFREPRKQRSIASHLVGHMHHEDAHGMMLASHAAAPNGQIPLAVPQWGAQSLVADPLTFPSNLQGRG